MQHVCIICLVLPGILKNAGESLSNLGLFNTVNARSEIKNSSLRNSSVNKGRNVTSLVAKSGDTSGLVLQLGEHELLDGLSKNITSSLSLNVRNIDAKERGSLEMSLGVRGSGELEHCGGSDSDRDTVRHQGVVSVVVGVVVTGVHTGDGVGETVANVHTGVSETNTSKSRSKKHVRVSLEVFRVSARSRKVLNGKSQTLQRENVSNGVRALVSGSHVGVLRSRGSLLVRDGCVGLERVAEDIQTRGSLDLLGHGDGVEGIHNSEKGLEGSVGNTSLGLSGHEIENGSSGGLGSGSSGGGDCDQRLELNVDGLGLTNGGVDKVQKLGIGEALVEVGHLGSIHDGASTNGQVGLGLLSSAPSNCVQHRGLLGLHADVRVEVVLDSASVERVERGLDSSGFQQVLVGEDCHSVDLHVLKVVAHLLGHAGSVSDVGCSHLEGVLGLLVISSVVSVSGSSLDHGRERLLVGAHVGGIDAIDVQSGRGVCLDGSQHVSC